MTNHLRLATVNDHQEIAALIQISAQKLGGEFYNKQTIEIALKGAFGVDSQLIKDQTFYIILQNNTIIACGGWSYRKTLFGSDSNTVRNSEKLNPNNEAAKIRAFFIHPHYSRLGFGKRLLDTCEAQAQRHGFSKTQLMSTLSGIDFYKKNGYQGQNLIYHNMDERHTIKFLPMIKTLPIKLF